MFHVPKQRRSAASVENLPVIAPPHYDEGAGDRNATAAVISRGAVDSAILDGLAFQPWFAERHFDAPISDANGDQFP